MVVLEWWTFFMSEVPLHDEPALKAIIVKMGPARNSRTSAKEVRNLILFLLFVLSYGWLILF